MKKTVLVFIVTALVVTGIAVLVAIPGFEWNIEEILMTAGVVLLVGFGIFVGIGRARSLRKGEPAEDELSKRIMVRSSSYSYYLSLYLWLVIMYLSDKTEMETHSLIGAGILGMAVIFLLSWIFVKIKGLRHE